MTTFKLPLPVAAVLLVSASLALAQSGNPAANRIKQWQDQNSLCRGLPGDDPRSQAACARRQQIQGELQRTGWCYGRQGQIGAQMQWHRCGRDSLRN